MNQQNPNTPQSTINTLESIHALAVHLSGILNGPSTPVNLYNAIADEVTPLYEEEGVKHAPEIDSVEYVERALLQRAGLTSAACAGR
jgi:hypothetical protein